MAEQAWDMILRYLHDYVLGLFGVKRLPAFSLTKREKRKLVKASNQLISLMVFST
jgi:hypothetical protein